MGKFYQRPEFKILQKEWYEKLSENNFKDQEDSKENLKIHDRRTKLWESREDILDFFLALDAYLTHNIIPERERIILELYSNGIHAKDIALRLELSRPTIYKIINHHKKILINIAIKEDIN